MVDELIPLKVSNGALKGPTLPVRLKVLSWGANDSTVGPKTVGLKTVAALAGNQRTLGYERVAIDFDHCSLSTNSTYKELLKNGQPPLIFGYGKPVVVENEGTFLEDITWTPLGEQHARNFEDLSPTVRERDGEVDFIHSVALTPNGCVHGLQFFSVNHNQNTPTMLTKAVLADLLGLSANAEDSVILAELKKRLTQPAVDLTPLSSRIASLETKPAPAAAGTDLTPLATRIEKLETELTALRTTDVNLKREELVALFAREGKAPKKNATTAYTTEELKGLDLSTLQLLHANTPVTVALSARTGGHQTESKKSFKDANGKVDLAAALDAENAAAGLSLDPPSNIA